MNIYILNASNTYNYGSMMMAENFIHYFELESKDGNTYYVETDDMENTQRRLRTATGLECINCVPMGSLYRKGDISKLQLLASLLFRLKVLSGLALKMDMVIVLGGDDYTEDYGWRTLVSQLLRTNVIAGRLKVYFLGQTMGPFYSFRRPLARYFLSKADSILVRDKITYDYLKGLGMKNIGEVPDLALMPLTCEEDIEKKGRYICLFPSELIFHFSKDKSRQACLDFYKKVCGYLMSMYPDKELVLLAHVLKPASSDDRVMARDIYNSVKDDDKGRIRLIDTEMYPYEVRNFIKDSCFIVSARMHPIISALECQVPWICFSYSRKYWGILGEGYKLGDYILDVRECSFEELYMKFELAIEHMKHSYTNISGSINSKLGKDQKEILDQISVLAERGR